MLKGTEKMALAKRLKGWFLISLVSFSFFKENLSSPFSFLEKKNSFQSTLFALFFWRIVEFCYSLKEQSNFRVFVFSFSFKKRCKFRVFCKPMRDKVLFWKMEALRLMMLRRALQGVVSQPFIFFFYLILFLFLRRTVGLYFLEFHFMVN